MSRTMTFEHYKSLMPVTVKCLTKSELFIGLEVTRNLKFKCASCEHRWRTSARSAKQNKFKCPSCTMNAMKDRMRLKLTRKEFQARCPPEVKLLGDYVKCGDRVSVKCRTCDHRWSPEARSLLDGFGCRMCNRGNHRFDQEMFLKRAREKHGNLYSYSKVVFTGVRGKIWIRCKAHGLFEQKAIEHLRGSGCSACTRNGGHSKIALRWIRAEAELRGWSGVRTAEHLGEFVVPGTLYKVDGYHKESNTILEFHGDIFHGNPNKCHPFSRPNPFSKKMAFVLYRETKKRESALRALGYNLIVMWESEYRRIREEE